MTMSTGVPGPLRVLLNPFDRNSVRTQARRHPPQNPRDIGDVNAQIILVALIVERAAVRRLRSLANASGGGRPLSNANTLRHIAQ